MAASSVHKYTIMNGQRKYLQQKKTFTLIHTLLKSSWNTANGEIDFQLACLCSPIYN